MTTPPSPFLDDDRSSEVIAALITAVILLLAGLSVFLPAASIPPHLSTTPEHVQLLNLSDSGPGRRAHKILLLLTTLTALAIVAGTRVTKLDPLASRLQSLRTPWQVALYLLCPALIWFAANTVSQLVAGVALTSAVIFLGARWGARRWFDRAVLVAVVLYMAATILPGLALPPTVTDPKELLMVEWHYSVVLSQGDRLSQGLRYFEHIAPHYGLLVPFLLGLSQKLGGLISFGHHIRLVQTMQVVFALAALLCFLAWSRRRWFPAAVAFIPTMAAVFTLHWGVFYPNQSGWRSAGFPLGLLLLLVTKPSGTKASWLLGAAFGGLFLFNPETAVAVGTGYLVFIATELLPGRSRGRWIKVTSLFAASAAGIVLVFALTVRLIFGHWPFPAPGSAATTLARFSSGYGGLALYFHVTWIVMLCHALLELLTALLRLHRQALDIRGRLRAAFAAMLLIWFGYFFNRPHPWNLWTFFFLYGFFVVDLVHPARLASYLQSLRRGRPPLGAALIAVFLVANALNTLSALRVSVSALRDRSGDDTTTLSDVRVPRAYAAMVQRKADFVRRQKASQPTTAYFTTSMYSIPLVSGVFPDLPMADPFVEGFTNSDFEHLLTWIARKEPRQLLFDDPAAGWDGPTERKQFMRRLQGRLIDSYLLTDHREGWEVWTRRAP